MNKERLLKFADFLDKLSPDLFDFSLVMTESDGNDDLSLPERMQKALNEGLTHNCGAVGCAIGWLPAFDPESFEWNSFWVQFKDPQNFSYDFDAAAKYFEIGAEVYGLFSLSYRYYGAVDWDEVRPNHVAQAIRELVRSNDA